MFKIIGFFLIVFSGLVGAEELEFRFIGNMAFAISDGKVTLYTDFPYESGAFGYMKYDLKDVKISKNGFCLITHSHRDHWAAELFQPLNLKLIGPPDVLRGVDPSHVVPFAKEIQYEGIRVQAFPTPHGHNITHYSYLVIWHGVRMYFTGDTEELETLLSMKDLDAAFISPWLAQALSEKKQSVDAKRIFVYHHADGENVVPLEKSIAPKQGQVIRIPFRES